MVSITSIIQESCYFLQFIQNFLLKNMHIWLHGQQLSSSHLCPIENFMDLCQHNFPRQCILLYFTETLQKQNREGMREGRTNGFSGDLN